MRSTGEVMGIDRDFALAFAKSQIASGSSLPASGTVFVSVKDGHKDRILQPVRELVTMGYKVWQRAAPSAISKPTAFPASR